MRIPLRRATSVVHIGSRAIGGRHPVAIQSMVKVKTSGVKAVLAQIRRLAASGCEIIRVAVKDTADAAALAQIKAATTMPLVADIHFDWRLAVAAIESGVDKIRLNPGNIYRRNEVREVVRLAAQKGIPIRVGLNSGSLAGVPGIARHKGREADRMVAAAKAYVRMLEELKFRAIVVSLKASNVRDTVEAYRKMSRVCRYPLHLGVTATGTPYAGAIKSSIAIGALLLEGIGDTIRISLTDTPEAEVSAARLILEAVNLRHFGPEIISCPTCGRCTVNLVGLVRQLQESLSRQPTRRLSRPLKVAIMGCVVNGPGEAAEADIGIAFGRREGLLFKKGRPVKKVASSCAVEVLVREIAAAREKDT